MKFSTPDTSHIDRNLVYEPAGKLNYTKSHSIKIEDSFALLDALENDSDYLKSLIILLVASYLYFLYLFSL